MHSTHMLPKDLNYIGNPTDEILFCGAELPMKTRLELLGFCSAPLLNATYRADLFRQMILPRIRDLRLLPQSKWGCNTEALMRYYAAFIRPVVEYDHPLLLTGAKSPMDKAEVRQNSCAGIVSGSSAQARVANPRALFDIHPIRSRCKF